MTLPSIKQTLYAHGLLPARTSWGQHFLVDPSLLKKIAGFAGNLQGKKVIEVGAGPGSLTRFLIDLSPQHLWAIEKDTRCCKALHALQQHVLSNFQQFDIICDDALAIPWESFLPQGCVLVGNLPYYISVPLLLSWLRHMHRFDQCILMFQKEVAKRIMAPPGSSFYGRLSVMAQWKAVIKPLMTLSPQVFCPPPSVDSMVVRITPGHNPFVLPWELMENTTRILFGKRRKMLRAILKGVVPCPSSFLQALSISPGQRPQELSVLDVCRIAQALSGS